MSINSSFAPKLQESAKIQLQEILVDIKKTELLPAHFRHQIPIIGEAISTKLRSLRDVKRDSTKMTIKQCEELTAAISKTKREGIFPGLRVEKVNDIIGNGVFLDLKAKPLKPQTILGVYSGEYVVHQLDKVDHKDLDYAFNLCEPCALDEQEHAALLGENDVRVAGREYVIFSDGKKKGNWIRYVNHGGKNNNLHAQVARYRYKENNVQHEDFVVVVSVTKEIKPGEQLLLNYGKEFFEQAIGIADVTPQTYTLPLKA